MRDWTEPGAIELGLFGDKLADAACLLGACSEDPEEDAESRAELADLSARMAALVPLLRAASERRAERAGALIEDPFEKRHRSPLERR